MILKTLSYNRLWISWIPENSLPILASCKKAGFRYFGIEGEQNAKWVLMDYGDIVVHIFVDETRWFYNLERLWGDARRVDLESD